MFRKKLTVLVAAVVMILMALMMMGGPVASGADAGPKPDSGKNKGWGDGNGGGKGHPKIPVVEPPPDTIAPETTVTAGLEQHSTSQSESATFEFTSSEPNSTFECLLRGGSFTAAVKGEYDLDLWHQCTSPMTYSPLRDDNIYFYVRAIDAAGNIDPTPAERIFTVQRPGPSLRITNGPEDRSTINADSVTFEWTTDGATPVDSNCQFRGPSGWVELFNSCSSPKTYQLTEDGYYAFNVFIEDATGNSTSMEGQFAVDTSSSY